MADIVRNEFTNITYDESFAESSLLYSEIPTKYSQSESLSQNCMGYALFGLDQFMQSPIFLREQDALRWLNVIFSGRIEEESQNSGRKILFWPFYVGCHDFHWAYQVSDGWAHKRGQSHSTHLYGFSENEVILYVRSLGYFQTPVRINISKEPVVWEYLNK
jgi:hypothetical protein